MKTREKTMKAMTTPLLVAALIFTFGHIAAAQTADDVVEKYLG